MAFGLGPPSCLLGASWGLVGASWGPLGASWVPPGASWAPLGAESWDYQFVFPLLGSSWDRFGALGRLERLLGRLGALLGSVR
eukprot:6513950-Pyramimonas_sp.AAC.1